MIRAYVKIAHCLGRLLWRLQILYCNFTISLFKTMFAVMKYAVFTEKISSEDVLQFLMM